MAGTNLPKHGIRRTIHIQIKLGRTMLSGTEIGLERGLSQLLFGHLAKELIKRQSMSYEMPLNQSVVFSGGERWR